MKKIDLAYIIDDDEIIIHLTGEILEKADFCETTETFTDGHQAIERLKQVIRNGGKFPDVILFDLNMPVMDGWEFMGEYLQLPLQKSIPLFIFTSSIDPADQERAAAFKSIKGYIHKPLTLQKLDKIYRIIS